MKTKTVYTIRAGVPEPYSDTVLWNFKGEKQNYDSEHEAEKAAERLRAKGLKPWFFKVFEEEVPVPETLHEVQGLLAKNQFLKKL